MIPKQTNCFIQIAEQNASFALIYKIQSCSHYNAAPTRIAHASLAEQNAGCALSYEIRSCSHSNATPTRIAHAILAEQNAGFALPYEIQPCSLCNAAPTRIAHAILAEQNAGFALLFPILKHLCRLNTTQTAHQEMVDHEVQHHNTQVQSHIQLPAKVYIDRA